MRIKQAILLCTLLICISASYDMTYIIYHNRINGPARKSVRIFSNFDLSNQPAENLTSELTHATTFINQVMRRYGQDNFQSGADYFLQCYKDTSLSIVAYIYYVRQSHTLTDRYYGIRVRDGAGLGNITLLGHDTCQACRAGRDMPFFNYDTVDIDSFNETVLNNFMRDLNNHRRISRNGFSKANITMIKSWSFPNGTLYVPCLRFRNNNTQVIAVVLNTTTVNMRFINSQMIPYIVGNIPIDYVYVRNYIEKIRKKRFGYGLNNTIPIFQYYLDPIYKDLMAFAVTFCRHGTEHKFEYSRFMGYIQTFQLPLTPNTQTPVIVYELNFTTSNRPEDFNMPYFVNRTGHTRMRSTLNNSREYQLLFRNAASIGGRLNRDKLLDLFAIDFPDDETLYMLVYEDNQGIYHQFQFMQKHTFKPLGSVYQRTVLMNQSFNNNSDWKVRTKRLEEYTTQLLITNGVPAQRARQKYFPFSQYCSIFNGRFELTVMHSSTMDTSERTSQANYCYPRYVFIEDIPLNRIRYQGLFRPPSTACHRLQSNQRLFPTSACSNLNEIRLNKENITRIFNSLSRNPLTNSQGQPFIDSEVLEAFFINSATLGANSADMYYIGLNKNGVSSYFILNGGFGVIDYVEKSNPEEDNKNSPFIGNRTSQNSTNSTRLPSNNSTNTTNNSSQSNQTTTNSTLNVESGLNTSNNRSQNSSNSTNTSNTNTTNNTNANNTTNSNNTTNATNVTNTANTTNIVNTTNVTNTSNLNNNTNAVNSTNTTNSNNTSNTNNSSNISSVNTSNPNSSNTFNNSNNSNNSSNRDFQKNQTRNDTNLNSTNNSSLSPRRNEISLGKINGKGNLSLQFIRNIYVNLSAIILSHDPNQQQFDPTIYYYIGAYNQLTVYGVIYNYLQMYVLYEIVHLSANNTFIYIGRSFLSEISSLNWEPKPVASPGQILRSTANEINRIQSLRNVAASNVSVMGLTFANFAYFFVQVKFMNGFNFQLSLLRCNQQWWPIFNFLDKSNAISMPPPERIPVFILTRAQVEKDINIIKFMTILQNSINKITVGFIFSKIERGRFENGSLYYILTYTKQDVSSTLTIQIIFDPLNSRVLYGHYEQKLHPKPQPTRIASAIASSPNSQQLLLKEIIDCSLKMRPQLVKYKEVFYQVRWKDDYYEWTLTYVTKNGLRFQQTLKISPVDLIPQEVSFIQSS